MLGRSSLNKKIQASKENLHIFLGEEVKPHQGYKYRVLLETQTNKQRNKSYVVIKNYYPKKH